MSLKRDDKVEITGSTGPIHWFEIGSQATVIHVGSHSCELVGASKLGGHRIIQTVLRADFKVIEQVVPKQTKVFKPLQEKPAKVPAPKSAKPLYAVVAKSSKVIAFTKTREEARQIKATAGGKAKGYSIVVYKATEEIR